MAASLRIAAAQRGEWPTVAQWVFAHLHPPLASRRADRLIRLILNGEIPPAGLLLAHEGETAVGGMVAQYLPGGTAVVLPPGGESEAVREALTAAAVAAFAAAGVSVAQAFVEPDEESRADVLARHGFHPVTSVLHLSRDGLADSPPFVARPEIALVPYAAADPHQFAETLMRTYQNSLDVPEANTGRSAADAIAGYRFGQPESPEWWLATDRGGASLGVLLLTDFAEHALLEVAYLGVVPEARGRGIGTWLLEVAIRRAASAGCVLNLSVDERNHPARRLYARSGFRIRQSQRVLLWVRAVSAR